MRVKKLEAIERVNPEAMKSKRYRYFNFKEILKPLKWRITRIYVGVSLLINSRMKDVQVSTMRFLRIETNLEAQPRARAQVC